jgi:hypothetical protein
MKLTLEFPSNDVTVKAPLVYKVENAGLKVLLRSSPVWGELFRLIGGDLYVYHHCDGIARIKDIVSGATTISVYTEVASSLRSRLTRIEETHIHHGTFSLSNGESDMVELDCFPYDHVLETPDGKFICGINISSRFVGVCDIPHRENEKKMKEVCDFIATYLPVNKNITLSPFVLDLEDKHIVKEVKIVQEKYPEHMIASVQKRLSALAISQAKEINSKAEKFRKEVAALPINLKDDFALHLGRLGFHLEENQLITRPKLKLYDFMYNHDGQRWRLKNDTHIGYIESISFDLSQDTLYAISTGYHPNVGPWLKNHTELYNKATDDVIQEYIGSGKVCLGSLNGMPFTLRNVLEAYTMLLLPDLHNPAWGVAEQYRKIVDLDEAMKWRS